MSNSGAAKPERIVHLDRPRKVVLNLNAFCLMEEALEKKLKVEHHESEMKKVQHDPNYRYQPFPGVSVFEEISWEKPRLRDMRLILWASLLTDDPTLTLEELSDMITIDKLQELSPVIQELVFSAMPQPEKRQEGEVEEQKKLEPHHEA